MTRFAPQWLQAGSYAASVDRRLIGALWPGPASAGGQVSATTGMALQAAPGQVAVPAGNGTGSVLCSWDAPETVTLDPAPPSGTNRIDLIVCQVRSTDVGGSGADDFVITFIAGAQAATPVAPAVPQNAVALAQIAVTGGAAAIVAANITDRRPFGLNVASGAARTPVAPADPFQSFTAPDGEVWVAKGGVNGGAWKRARDVLHCYYWRAAAFSFGGVTATMVFDTVDSDPYGMCYSGAIHLPLGGIWLLNGSLGVTLPPNAWARIWKSYTGSRGGGFVSTVMATPVQVGAIVPMGASSLRMAAGDSYGMQVDALVTVTGAPGVANTWISANYLGTG